MTTKELSEALAAAMAKCTDLGWARALAHIAAGGDLQPVMDAAVADAERARRDAVRDLCRALADQGLRP